MSSKTLDKARPYGTVHGGDFEHRFEQDGRYFDGDGHECGSPGPAARSPEHVVKQAFDDGNKAASGKSTLPSVATGIALSSVTQAMALLGKSADHVIAELEDESDGALDLLETLETAGKARKTVLEAIAALRAKRAEPTGAAAAQTMAPTGAAGQVDQQLNA